MLQRVPLPLILPALLTLSATLSTAETQPFHLLEAGIEGIHSAFKSGRLTCVQGPGRNQRPDDYLWLGRIPELRSQP